MVRKKNDGPAVDLSATAPKAAAAEWSEKEHISEPAIVAAQNLLETAGSLELAKQALATAARRNTTPRSPRTGRANTR